MKKGTGTVTLVGAGCGSRDLMTLRGMQALKACDAVVYDSLIDKSLLDFCPGAEKICVGKRAGQHSAVQEEINRILVELAKSGKNVVRLKGGDPFVFGRGGEEILELKRHGVRFDIVPGVTSCVAVPELAGIPVTHRRSARSFHVITGHTADSCTPERLEQYAGLDGTLVFLMGLNSLGEIAAGLVSGGMPGSTPAAVISDGASARQRTVRGVLSDIAEKVSAAGLSAPAVIVVGETAGYDLSPDTPLPLRGVRVAVISTPETAEKLSGQLGRLGADVYRAGGMKVCEFPEPPADITEKLGGCTHIALTSPNGARMFLKMLREFHVDHRSLSGKTFAAVGPGTAGALGDGGIYADLMPEEYNTASLGRLLSSELTPQDRLLILRSEEGSPELTQILDAAGARYDDVKLYRTAEKSGSAVDCGFAVFTSAGAARSFFEAGGSLSAGTAPVAIGKITAAELKRHGVENIRVSAESTTEGIVNTILGAAECRDSDD